LGDAPGDRSINLLDLAGLLGQLMTQMLQGFRQLIDLPLAGAERFPLALVIVHQVGRGLFEWGGAFVRWRLGERREWRLSGGTARRLVNDPVAQSRQRFTEIRAGPDFPPLLEQRGPPGGNSVRIGLQAKTGIAKITIAGGRPVYMDKITTFSEL
jgi:hypothetical protein